MRPICFAVLRLMTNSTDRYPIRGTLFGCCAWAMTATASSITTDRIDKTRAFSQVLVTGEIELNRTLTFQVSCASLWRALNSQAGWWHAASKRTWLSTRLDRASRKMEALVQGLECEERLGNHQTLFLLALTLPENQRNDSQQSPPPPNQTNQRFTLVCITSLRRKRFFYDYGHRFSFSIVGWRMLKAIKMPYRLRRAGIWSCEKQCTFLLRSDGACQICRHSVDRLSRLLDDQTLSWTAAFAHLGTAATRQR